ncbi:tail fiber domain-containing protein [Xanthomarina sp. F2636L]|uniref:tail fiber domain-containing protein n=1 Tax=Xanthomarina sp. F2636L TaxID=2996018 RepID=UPI00225E1CBB|nr:tail fiber domain-containing protein [Xanthomarina sp. F2636L]MCX7550479.1 tail fiber domain-containing protein [Xanthomarina sp. F2636L]
MKKLCFTIAFLCVAITFAQQGINYKVFIKDGSGNVVANTGIQINFAIQKGATQTNVYQESHQPTTDANGMVILNIGEGTPISGTFNNIDWAADDHFLNVQIDTGSGLTNMGTTQFMAVPYAKQAEIATTAANVNGLETLDEGNGTGYRLVGRNPSYYGNIGLDAVDVSQSNFLGDNGATGDYAFASGRQVLASGRYAMANNYGTIVSADFATAFGHSTSAEAYASLALGRRNVGGGNPTTWVDTDPLLEVGNGFGATTSNALTILKNGTITAPSFELAEITDSKALITKEYLENTVTGLEAIDEGNGIGRRLVDRNPNYYGNIGSDAVDVSQSNTLGDYGATGDYAFASGRNAIASGRYAMANNYGNTASADFATAIGYITNAEAYASFVLGRRNVGGGNPTAWIDTDPLLEVGNGYGATTSNALTILKNGTITAPSFDITEITDPKALVTKEYLTGLEAINEGNGIGWRLRGRDPDNYDNIGLGAVDLSEGSGSAFGASGAHATALGYRTIASGNYATTMGAATTASGNYATATGSYTTASGDYTTAMGYLSVASNDYATAMGRQATASGEYATAMGIQTTASGTQSTVMGSYSEALGFRSIAMGNQTTASGNYSVAIGRGLESEAFASTAIGSYNVGGGSSSNWLQTDPLFEIGNGGSDNSRYNAFTVYKNGNATLSGSLSQNSDRRLKRDIETLSYGLNEILQLIPKQYYWKNRGEQTHKSLGLIAQEVQPIISELVHTANDENNTLSVSYTELIPILIKAIQEQQKIIESQKKENLTQKTELSALETNYKTLLSRIEALETKNYNKKVIASKAKQSVN